MAELVYALVSGASRATGVGSTPIQCTIYALVAQLDRVQPSEGWGQAFESPRAHHETKTGLVSRVPFFDEGPVRLRPFSLFPRLGRQIFAFGLFRKIFDYVDRWNDHQQRGDNPCPRIPEGRPEEGDRPDRA